MPEERIALTEKQKQTIQTVLKQIQELNQAVANYLKGLGDGMGLEGNWNLDPTTMELVKQEEQPQPKKE